MKKRRCYIYTRVSTSMQVEGYSLEAQKERLRKYADFQEMVIVGEYSDEGKSGKSIEGRQEFMQMLRDIEEGKDRVEFVLVYKLSRFGRNAADVLNSLQRMQDFGVNLICVEDGIDSSKDSGMEVHPVLTPERMEKRQNGRRMKEDGEPMFTLTSQDRHGVFVCEKVQQNEETMLRVRNGTKQGYDEAHVGDGISLAYPESDTRRGRVGKGCSQTLDCSGQMGTLMKCGRIRRLTPRECFRLQGFPDVLFDKAASVNSDAQLYKQAGNAVTATVAFAVAMSLPESREN